MGRVMSWSAVDVYGIVCGAGEACAHPVRTQLVYSVLSAVRLAAVYLFKQAVGQALEPQKWTSR